MRVTGKNIELTIDNVVINYDDVGDEKTPSIIFIHGFPLNKSMWAMQVDALKSTYRVIAYDIRGHGNSDAGDAEISIDLFVNDLINLMDTLELDNAILCGLSMGGYIALRAIENYPERFEALILSDTQCAADTQEGKEKRLKAIKSIKENGVEKYADENINNLFAPESFTTRIKEIATVKNMILEMSVESLTGTLLALSRREETCSKLKDIKIPVLIMVGSEDKITPASAAQVMHERIQDSFLKAIAHAGHLSNLENPSVFNHHLKKFLFRFAWKQFHYN
ncbi:MAG TPA: alpha/beta fold hydrolase [Cyclobacteriaceae bacterium]|nr:alpha/beta fold hydrolase [Cyclobacteriaceae bacterium]